MSDLSTVTCTAVLITSRNIWARRDEVTVYNNSILTRVLVEIAYNNLNVVSALVT